MAKPASRSKGGRRGGSVFTGVLIGLVVGAVLAVGVALWATGVNPFKSAEPASPREPEPAARTRPDPAPSFDFYKVLPGDRAADVPSTPPPRAATPAPRYYLQAGAFRNPADADNLKAQLALLGVSATIQTSEVGDKGLFHRVRVGPYRATNEMDRVRALLTQNDIPTTVVKEIPKIQETP